MKEHNTTKARKAPPKVTFVSADNNLTSQAGLIPVVHFLNSLSLSLLAANILPKERGSNGVYQLADIVHLAIISFIGGATSLSGMITIWGDTVLQRLAGFLKIPHETHFGRLWKEFQMASVSSLESLNHLMRKQAWGKVMQQGMTYFWGLRTMWIDIDSTVVSVFGKQEGAEKGYNPEHKGRLSYHPLLAFCAHTKEILQGWFRCGSAYTANGTIDFLRQLFAQMPTGIRYLIRGDSGYFDGKLFSFLEEGGLGYLIKVKMKNLASLLSSQTWEIKTVRTFVIRLAGKLVKSGRQYTLKMPISELYSMERDAWFQMTPG